MADPFKTRWSGIGVGGALALDFVNTLDWRLRPVPVELLRQYPDLLRWAWSAGALDPAETRTLMRWAEEHPRLAEKALAGAVATREAIANVFQAVSRAEPVPRTALGRVEAASRAAWSGRALEPASPGATWVWRSGPVSPERPEWAAALDAVRLLTTDAVERVRECGDDQCGWLFIDTSRNRSRRWCTMEGCGNRNKARSFYRRNAARARSG
jgi:predicted RNA-binding Zn ribbon-like protein